MPPTPQDAPAGRDPAAALTLGSGVLSLLSSALLTVSLVYRGSIFEGALIIAAGMILALSYAIARV